MAVMVRDPDLTDNARRIFDLRYARKDDSGHSIETPGEAIDRVVTNVASVNALYAEPREFPDQRVLAGDAQSEYYPDAAEHFPFRTAHRQYDWLRRAGKLDASLSFTDRIAHGWYAVARQAGRYREMLTNLDFVPNSPTWTGAGTGLGQLAACFVLPIEDDLGKGRAGIFETLKVAALIQQTGGGNGFSFSRLRPKGALVVTSNGKASGPVGFLEAYDAAFGVIAQGGTRRGANMGVLRIDHPDVREFIEAKTVEGRVANFNISVAVTDEFMEAVDKDEDFDLVHGGDVYETISARSLYDYLVDKAWIIGDPGTLFIDRANRDNPLPGRYELEATNPCVTGDTLVQTPGGWRRVDSITEGEIITTVLGSGQVERVEVYPERPVFKVTLSDGGVVRATAAHQFHVRDSRSKFFEERTLDKVEVGDWVRVSMTRAVPEHEIEVPVGMTDRSYGFALGVIVGDGCYSPKTLARNVVAISTHSDEDGWNDALAEALAGIPGIKSVSRHLDEGGTSSGRLYARPNPRVADLVRAASLLPATSCDKVLSDWMLDGSNGEFLRGLIDGLYSTDGSVDLSSNHPLVRFHTGSRELALQVRRILLMFGIHGRVSESQRVRHDIDGRTIRHDRPKYDVLVSGASLGRFIAEFTLTHPDKQARLREATRWCNHTGGNFAAKVVSIEPDGIETVYDLFEPESDTWITEGYVSRGCGEQWLGPYENCCLGSINLSNFAYDHQGGGYIFDWERLAEVTRLATQFLDDVIDANQYVSAVPELEEAAQGARRIGLGGMGLADAMAKLGYAYGSPAGMEFASQVTEWMRYHSMLASIDRARDRGSFEWIEGSIYDPALLAKFGPGAPVEHPKRRAFTLWDSPEPLRPHNESRFGRPAVDWDEVYLLICEHGIRNAAQMTYAPTGTISNVAGVQGSGCEPFFALSYQRNVMQEGENITLDYLNPLFEEALRLDGLTPVQCEEVLEQVKANGGSCQGIEAIPASVRDAFVVAADVSPEDHVMMQAAIQAFVDNSISKTINLPHEATPADVSEVYKLAFALGCKGITVYRQGSRELEVLSARSKAKPVSSEPEHPDEREWGHVEPMPIPEVAESEGLPARILKVRTPHGSMWASITEHPSHPGRPFDVRLTVGKAGNDKLADIEAVGRTASLALRSGVPVGHVVSQLEGIGGQSTFGYGPHRVRSAADGLARALRRIYLDDQGTVEIRESPKGDLDPTRVCPNCHNASLVFEQGCFHCEVRLGGCGTYEGCE